VSACHELQRVLVRSDEAVVATLRGHEQKQVSVSSGVQEVR
jgi:hypothetical protein